LQHYRSNGKLLLTGEYVVLDGALALAVPTAQGQSLKVNPQEAPLVSWRSFDEQGQLWFEDEITLDRLQNTNLNTLDPKTPSLRLLQILAAAQQLNPKFLNSAHGVRIETHLEFPRHWGLGTSSTLIYNLSQWANINPYALLNLTFGGSGYDIACAQHHTPIHYQIETQNPVATAVKFNPEFKDHLYFVYLNTKQNSREGIARYKALKGHLGTALTEISAISEAMLACKDLNAFNTLIHTHETIIAQLTQQDTVASRYFKDFKGAIKSLGAWGGDFILATGTKETPSYFKNKGFETILTYSEMIL
jgi:mevalonate kinase